MTTKDMATKLGFTYTTKKTLVEGGAIPNSFYARTDHILTKNDSPDAPYVFRDKTAVNLFLESKAQLELIKESKQPAKRS